MCDSCEVLYINGIKCHEQGCPNTWKDYKKECKWCSQEFISEDKYQEFCSDDCFKTYNY